MLIPEVVISFFLINSYWWNDWDWNLLERWIGWSLAWHNLGFIFHLTLGRGIGWSWKRPSILFCRWVVRVYRCDYSVRTPRV